MPNFYTKQLLLRMRELLFLGKLCKYNTLSITGSNVYNKYDFNINMSNFINGNVSNRMKLAYTGLVHFLMNNGNMT